MCEDIKWTFLQANSSFGLDICELDFNFQNALKTIFVIYLHFFNYFKLF